MQLWKSALPALLLTACGPKGAYDPVGGQVHDPCQPLRLALEGEVSDHERDLLRDAVQMWNVRAGTRLEMAPIAPLRHAEGAPPPLGESVPTIAVRLQSAALLSRGLYDDARGIIFLNRDLTDPHQFLITAAHELGHAFGLAHVPASRRRSLMNPANHSVELTTDDVAELEARWGRCDDR